MKPEKILVFDLGGVIVSFDHMTICNRLSKVSAHSPDEVYDVIFNSGLEKLFDEGQFFMFGFYKEICKVLEIEISYEEFIPIWSDIFTEIPEMIDLIFKLREKGYITYLLSNTNELHFGHCYKNYPVLEGFDKFILSYCLGFRKPDPRIYQKAIEMSGLPPEKHIYIDDIELNVKGAEAVGMIGIHYQSFEQFKEALDALEIQY
jgi:glucose-1-phosphatase